jgi:DNA polymerase family A
VNVFAYDTETELFRPGKMAPDLVCISWQRPGFPPELVHAGGIDDRAAKELIKNALEKELIVGHHVAFDNAVIAAKWPDLLPLIFRAYDEDRMECTKIRQQLLDIAAGEFRGKLQQFSKEVEQEDGTKKIVEGARWITYDYTLDACTYRAAGRRLEKDTWRLRYAEFKNTTLTQWPEGARTYPKEDARATLDVFLKQEEHAEFIPDRFAQARSAWALHLTSVWGLKTHGPSVEKLERETIAALAAIEDGLKEVGLVRANGSRDTKLAQKRMIEVCQASGKPLRFTDGGAPSLDSDACEASEDDLLQDYAELTALKAMLNKDIPVLKAGITYPVHTSYGLAASGRSTSRAPNVQNPKRSGAVYRDGKIKYELPDVRECWAPRDGYIYAQADFDQLELRTLAQVCYSLFGHSALGDMLNAGKDPHTAFACSVLSIPYEEGARRKKDKNDKEFDNNRQLGKVFNFGSPGGLGAEKLCLFARKTYKVILTPERAKELKILWLKQFPEMKEYFQHVANLMNEDTGLGVIQQLFSKRWRGGGHYTALCNGFFQGLGADAAKRALYLVVRACYAEPESVLYGSRPVLFCHDEIITEVKNDELAHDRAMEMSRLMIQGANEYLPNVPSKADPVLATRWSKKMEPVFDENKRLIPWSPAEAA